MGVVCEVESGYLNNGVSEHHACITKTDKPYISKNLGPVRPHTLNDLWFIQG